MSDTTQSPLIGVPPEQAGASDPTAGVGGGSLPAAAPASGEPWEVEDDAALGWCLRHIANARSRIAEQRATAEAHLAKLRGEVAAIEAWLDHATREDRGTIDRMTARAIDYLGRLNAADPTVKSRSTPWGVVKSHQVPPDIRREDEAALLAWAQSTGFVRARIEVDWQRVKQAATVKGERLVLDGGEVVPGCRAVTRPRSFSVVIDE